MNAVNAIFTNFNLNFIKKKYKFTFFLFNGNFLENILP